MNFLLNNWQVLVAIVAVVAIAGLALYNFATLPREAQLNKVKEWLLWAVVEAEKTFGSGTGILKLRYVYDLFLGRFPALVKVVSFEKFSVLVDSALDKMRDLLDNNEKIEAYVEEG